MKAIITCLDEPTLDLCKWSLERNGLEVLIFKSDTSLWQKLKDIYDNMDEDFLRIDADVIVNKNLNVEKLGELARDDTIWWWQFTFFDWYKCDIAYGGAFIRKQALPDLRANIDRFKTNIRPETGVSRIEALHNPRRMITYDKQIMGIHGYGIKDIKPVIKLKSDRGQSHFYDFELARKLNELS